MKTEIPPTASRRPSAAIPLLLAGLLLTAPAGAQTTAPLPTPPAPAQAGANADKALEETIELSPFEVRAESDTSYGALNSNSITRFNTELNKMPVSADVFTEEFMRDVAATSVEQLLSDYGAGVGISSTSPDSDAGSNQPGDRLGNLQVGARGLAAGMIHRDGFTATGSFANPGATAVGVTSTFDTERAEVIRGPQGLLYGAGGAGGTINTVSKRASFNRQGGSMLFRVDQYGTKHGEFDYNWGKNWFAFRLSLLGEDLKYRRVFIGGKTRGFYSQFAFRLPYRTTLRVQTQLTQNDRINSTNVNDINFTNTATDPRHNYSFSYLLATGRAGATDPAGMVRWDQFSGVADPLSRAFTDRGMNWSAGIISFGAVFATTSVLLVFQLGQPRILFSMARDGLLPPWAARVHPRFRTPHLTTMLTGAFVAGFAAVTNINEVVELCNIGTLFAFVLVAAGIIILRRTDPDRPRPFRTPLVPWVPLLAILSCGYLMAELPWVTWLRFVIWLGLGLIFYFLYGARRSRLNERPGFMASAPDPRDQAG